MVEAEEDAGDLEDERRARIATLLRRKGDELVYREIEDGLARWIARGDSGRAEASCVA